LWLGIAFIFAGALLIGAYLITPTYWHAIFGLR